MAMRQERSAATTAGIGLFIVAFLWGAIFATGKAAVHDVPPFTVALLRFGIAALVLLPVYMRERRGQPLLPRTRSAWRALVLLGITAVAAYNALFFGGLSHAPSSDAILLVPTTSPVWTALFAALILGDRVTSPLRLGMLITIGGMALVLVGGSSGSFSGERLAGNVMFVAAALVFGLSHVVGRVATRHVSPLGATTIAGVIGSALLLPVAVAEGGLDDLLDAGIGFWLAVLFIAIAGTALAYVLWYQGIRQLGAGSASFFTNLVPIFALTLSAIFLDEYPTPLQLVGGAVMLGAVVWVTRRVTAPVPVPVPVAVPEP